MLPDPKPIQVVNLSTGTTITARETAQFATVDPGAGRSVSRGTLTASYPNCPAELIVAHSVSNDNKPVKTDRSLVRLNITLRDAAGKELTAYAYVVIGVPRGAFLANGTTAFVPYKMVEALIGAVFTDYDDGELKETTLIRILAGES